MNSNCVVATMAHIEDSLVYSLLGELKAEFETVELLALGSDQEIKVLQSKFKDILLPTDLDADFSCEHLVLLTLDSIFELDRLLAKFKYVSIWADPQVESASEDQTMVSALLSYGLAGCASDAISPRTSDGEAEWASYLGFEKDKVSNLFKINETETDADPLIEKSSACRILIDGESHITNQHMVGSFIAANASTIDCQVWCLYDGVLKPWMRPDYQVSTIPFAELPMYANSVDGYVLTGENWSLQRAVSFLQLGIVPIVVNEQGVERLSSIADVAKIQDHFPSFGSEDLLVELLEDPNELARFNALANVVSDNSAYFNCSSVYENNEVSGKLISFLKTEQYMLLKERYMEGRYGEKQGDSLHQEMAKKSKILGEFPGTDATEIAFSGWAVNKESAELCAPIVVHEESVQKVLLRRSNRHDVAEHFGFSTVSDIGFHGRYVVPIEDFDGAGMTYAVKISDTSCTNIHTIVEGLDATCDEDRVGQFGYELLSESEWGGCIETVVYHPLKIFDLGAFAGGSNECEIRFKDDQGYIDCHGLETFAEIGGAYIKLERTNLGDSSLILAIPEVSAGSARIFARFSGSDLEGLVCEVLSEDPSVVIESLPKVEAESSGLKVIEKEDFRGDVESETKNDLEDEGGLEVESESAAGSVDLDLEAEPVGQVA